MTLHAFVFLSVVCLLLSLALLWGLCWFPDRPFPLTRRGQAHDAPSSAEAPLPRRLLRLSPLLHQPVCYWTCARGCRVAFREVKSRRGAPKRIKTEGYACPNHQCLYFGITDAHIHALVGDGTHGRAERIQTFRGLACRTTFTRPS